MLKGTPQPRPEELTERARAWQNPRLPAMLRLANRALAPFASRVWPLTPQSLMAKARQKSGLWEFGDTAPLEEPLGLLCRSLDEEAEFHAFGRLSAHTAILNALVNRLRLEDLTKRHPEVFERPVAAPIFIVGLQRSGTTFLQRLMAQDPALRSIPFWEVMNPLPIGNAEPPLPDPDPRVQAGAKMISFINRISPELVHMHEMENEAPDEELVLLAMGFSSMLFETFSPLPGYLPWYTRADHTAGYAYLRRALQAMAWLRPAGDRWLLKSPQHLEQFRPLTTVFPDATLVQTHRDPVRSIVSLGSMMAYALRQNYDHPDPHLIGRQVTEMTERLLRAAVRDRAEDDKRFVDIQFKGLNDDPLGVVRAVYARADAELTPEAERRMTSYLSAQRARRVHHDYSAADLALDVPELRERFAFYYDRFDVPKENL